MKIYATVMIFASILSRKLGNGNRVSLSPSPEASVKEGETLDLLCEYTGASNLDFINWYLNDDRFGLVILTSDCSYVTKPEVYETYRYKLSCIKNSFTLSIANISKTNDDGDQWGCDNTIRGMQPPSKESTTIRVKETVTMNGNGGGSGEPSNVPAVIGEVFGGLMVLIVPVAAVGYIVYRRRKNKRTIDQVVEEHAMNALSDQSDPEEV